MGGFALTFQYVCKIVSAKIDADPSDAGRLPKDRARGHGVS